MMLIAIRLDAKKDVTGKEQKVTVLIDHMGQRHETRIGWPEYNEPGIHWGPIFLITPQEYLLECQIACGEV
jgi:hypothetical protein